MITGLQDDLKVLGFRRATVLSVNKKSQHGEVRVKIHGLSPPDDKEGIICRPANTPVCGFGSTSGATSGMVPPVGAQVLVGFENNNLNLPRYFCGLPLENDQGRLPAECRDTATADPSKVAVPIKTGRGSALVFNDKEGTTELTGPKANVDNYNTNKDNMSSVLIKEGQILVTTKKGDFISINSDGSIDIYASRDHTVVSDGQIYMRGKTGINIYGDAKVLIYGASKVDVKSAVAVNLDAPRVNLNCGRSETAQTDIPSGSR